MSFYPSLPWTDHGFFTIRVLLMLGLALSMLPFLLIALIHLKIIILGQNDQFYRSVDPDSNYGSARLKGG